MAEEKRTEPAPLDVEHLRLLTIFHYIAGGLKIAFSSLFLVHAVLGILMVLGVLKDPKGGGPPPAFGWIFVVMGFGVVLVGWSAGIGLIIAGRCIARRRRYAYCQIMAAVSCIFVPIGTILGVFSLMTLGRPSVKALFEPRP